HAVRPAASPAASRRCARAQRSPQGRDRGGVSGAEPARGVPAVNERIGELLVRENLLSPDQLRRAREESRASGNRLGAQITKLGYLDESELTDFVAKQYGVPSIDLDQFEIEAAVIALIPEEVALK